MSDIGTHVLYEVAWGDTLGEIARAFYGMGGRWPEIQHANEIADPNIIVSGQVLKIPLRELAPSVAVMPTTGGIVGYRFGTLYGPGPYEGIPHPGLDLGGAIIIPTARGVVVKANYDPRGYGFWTMLHHVVLDIEEQLVFDMWSLYAHMRHLNFGIGKRLFAHEALGYIGMTGNTSGPHLHVEWRKTQAMRLYGRLNEATLKVWFYDPRSIVENPHLCFLPPGTIGVPGR